MDSCSHHVAGFFLVTIVSLFLFGCGRTEGTVPVVPCAGLDAREQASFDQFCRDVVPILESRCAANCHGVSSEQFVKFTRSPEHAGFYYFPINPATGKIPDHESRLAAWRTSRGAESKHVESGPAEHEVVSRIDYREAPQFSPLIRVPLADQLGGLAHRGLDVFYTLDDPDYLKLRNWIETEIALRPGQRPTVPQAEAFFRDDVLPVLANNGCFLASCHGPHVFNDLKLQLPLPSPDGRFDPQRDFSSRLISENRQQLLGTVSRFSNAGGDLRLSRLLAKALPIIEGGVHHRGGNTQFFESLDDPDVKILLEWLDLERHASIDSMTSRRKDVAVEDVGRLQGIAFIRGPRHQPRRFFEFDTFWPGSDVFVLPYADDRSPSQTEALNVTAHVHPEGSVEIQSVDVRYDGRAIVFCMRRSAESGFRIYELELDDELRPIDDSFRQISNDPDRLPDGTLIHHVDAVYMPGPNDSTGNILDDVAVCFASNAAGHYAASEPFGLLGEAERGSGTELIDAQRTEAPGTFDGRRLYVIDGPNRGQWRTIVRHEQDADSVVGAKFELDAALPFPADRQTVYEIEQTHAVNCPSYDIWRVVPQRDASPQPQHQRRMTFTSAQERRPTIRTTGEVMFTSVRNIGYQADRPVFNGAIFRVMAGGFDYHIQGNNRSRYSLVTEARELPQGLETRLALDPRNHWSGGLLILADHGFGINLEAENPVDNIPLSADGTIHGQPMQSSALRYLHGQQTFFPETGADAVTMTGVSPGGSFRDPFPLPDGTILVSHVADSIDHLDEDADPNWNLYRLYFSGALQSEDGQRVGPVERKLISQASTDDMAEYCPRPIIVRLKETSPTHQKFSASHADQKPVLEDGVLRMPPETPGEVECYDYPLLQSFLTHFAPLGPRDFHGPTAGLPGSVADPQHAYHYVRIVTQVPPGRSELQPLGLATDPFATPISHGIHTRRLIVAEIPLEVDGTFYAEVPTGVPLIVQGLNKDRMALHSMNRWFYVQPGEKLTFSIPRRIFPTTCAGCHGALTGNSVDALGPPDIVSEASRVMATWDPVTDRRRAPYGHGNSAEDYISVDFRRDVQPILDRHCIQCHDGTSERSAGFDLRGSPTEHYTTAYETLHRLADPDSGQQTAKQYINEREALAVESFLIEKLMGKELAAPQNLGPDAAPHPAASTLSDDELLTLIRWIDLGATFVGGRVPKL
ncbi:MAG: hypothetical protein IT422_03950 [Pirellulaceae bacterium]|jgi:mono/diheme cytochrome c family protein|nr:hypothetical protein [Pirellulaceae bacterium]